MYGVRKGVRKIILDLYPDLYQILSLSLSLLHVEGSVIPLWKVVIKSFIHFSYTTELLAIYEDVITKN